MKIITDNDKIPLRHLDVLRIVSANKTNNGLILSQLASCDLSREDLEILDTDYGEAINTNPADLQSLS